MVTDDQIKAKILSFLSFIDNAQQKHPILKNELNKAFNFLEYCYKDIKVYTKLNQLAIAVTMVDIQALIENQNKIQTLISKH